jgi:hypothetical protein
MTKRSSSIPAHIRNELRRVLALKNLQTVFTKNAMTATSQNKFIYKLYHGDDALGIPSSVDMILNQNNSTFGSLFSLLRQEVVTSQSAEASMASVYELKPLFHRKSVVFVLGDHINKKLLESTNFTMSSPLFTGRQICAQADVTLRNVKIANSYAVTLVDVNGDAVKLGDSIEDFIVKVHDFMFVKFKGHASAEELTLAEEDEGFLAPADESVAEKSLTSDFNNENITPTRDGVDDSISTATVTPATNQSSVENTVVERPDDWSFAGYYAFILFGAFAPKEKRLTILSIEDSSKGTSRKKSRKDERRIAAEQRERSLGNPHNPAGLKLSDRVALANLDLQNRSVESNERNHDRLEREQAIISTKLQLDVLDRQINRAYLHNLSDVLDLLLKQEKDLPEQLANQSKPRISKKRKESFPLQDLVDLTSSSYSTPLSNKSSDNA